MQNVLDSLIPAQLADRNRKFIYAEQASIILSPFTNLDVHMVWLVKNNKTKTFAMG